MDLQPHVEHHGGDDVEVREVDAELPGQVEENEEGSGQPLAEHAIRPGRGRLGEPERGRSGPGGGRHAGAGGGPRGGAPAGAAQRRRSLQQNRKGWEPEACGGCAAGLLAEEDPGCVQQLCGTF